MDGYYERLVDSLVNGVCMKLGSLLATLPCCLAIMRSLFVGYQVQVSRIEPLLIKFHQISSDLWEILVACAKYMFGTKKMVTFYVEVRANPRLHATAVARTFV